MITVHLNNETADALIAQAGFTVCEESTARSRRSTSRGSFKSYTKPGRTPRNEGGQFGEDYLWEKDEALLVSLEILAEDVA